MKKMKKHSSSSPSKTSSRTGCISTLFRRILRGNSLPTHPADHDKNTESCASEKAKCSLDQGLPIEASGTPNLVAKLMGLDSVPVGKLKNDLSSVTRSRSMNSAESWKAVEGMQGRPRRTKSFRDIPSFRELEDENFYILSFENGYKNRKFASKAKKPENGFSETEKIRERGGKILEQCNENRGKSRREKMHENNKENLISPKSFSQSCCSETLLKDKTNVHDQKGTNDAGKPSGSKSRETLTKKKDFGGKTRIKRRKDDCLAVRINETESNSQNSNPDWVLDEIQLPFNGNNGNSLEVSSRLTSSKPRRTLWEELEILRKLNNPGKAETLIRHDQGRRERKENGEGSSKIIDLDFESKTHAEVLKQSCKLAEKEMLESNWMLKETWKLEDYEKVGKHLEDGILDQMIHELIYQVSAF